MKKYFIFILLTVIIIVTGCSGKGKVTKDGEENNKDSVTEDVEENNYVFKGENEFWAGELEVNATRIFKEKEGNLEYESKADKTLTVTYKNELADLSSIKNLVISYESSVGKGEIKEDFTDSPPTDKIYTLSSSTSGGAIESEDEVIKLSIVVDGKEQTIELKEEFAK